MIDPLAAEQVETRRDVHRRPVLGRVTRAVQARPRPRARKHSKNFSGGSGASAASMPRPITSSRRFAMHLFGHLQRHRGRVLAVHVGDQAAAHAEVGSAARHPSIRPSMIVAIGTPRVVCSVGLKNISRYFRLPSCHAVLERLVRDAREVVAVDHGRVHEPEDLEELVDRLVVVDAVDVVGRQRDVVLAGQVDDRLPGAACPPRGSAARPWAGGAGTRRSPSGLLTCAARCPRRVGRRQSVTVPPRNASIICPTSAPSGYSTGHVQPGLHVLAHLGPALVGRARRGDELHDVVGHELRRGDDLLVGRRPGQHLADLVEQLGRARPTPS